jgi:hypothetical protein
MPGEEKIKLGKRIGEECVKGEQQANTRAGESRDAKRNCVERRAENT